MKTQKQIEASIAQNLYNMEKLFETIRIDIDLAQTEGVNRLSESVYAEVKELACIIKSMHSQNKTLAHVIQKKVSDIKPKNIYE